MINVEIDRVTYKDLSNKVKTYSNNKSVQATSTTNMSKVMHSYFRLVLKDILKGNKWVFPNGFGTLSIIRVSSGDNSFKKFNKKKYFEEGKREDCFNPKTIGYYCKYKFDSEVLKRHGMVFKPSKGLKTILKELLLSRENNFSYE